MSDASAASAATVTPAAALIADLQQLYFSAYPLMRLAEHPAKGRYIVASESVREGQTIFEAVAYSKGVHESFKKRVCDACTRYNHAGRYELSCTGCHAVWYCSQACQARAQGLTPPSAATSAEVLGSADEPPLAASELHALDCALLRKLSTCKLDKARMGVIRLIIRTARKMQYEQRAEEEERSRMQQAQAAESSHSVVASAVASSTAPPSSNPLISDATAPPARGPIAPSFRDVENLVGHAAAPLVPGVKPSLHQLDTSEMRRFLEKIVATSATTANSNPSSSSSASSSATPRELPPLDVEVLMQLLARVESNAFGFYAPKSSGSGARKDLAAATAADGELEQQLAATSITESQEGASATGPPAAATPAASVSSSAAPTTGSNSSSSGGSGGSKYIGVLLYPLASYFNHSCRANVRVVQEGSKLSMVAARDIEPLEEMCIEYIDCNQTTQARRAELLNLYRFECTCPRCELELSAAATNDAASGGSSAKPARISYATPSSRERSGQKKGQPIKRKKIVPKVTQAEAEEKSES